MQQPSHLENVLRAGLHEKQRRGSNTGPRVHVKRKVKAYLDYWKVDIHVSALTCPENGSGMAWTQTIKTDMHWDNELWAGPKYVSDEVKKALDKMLLQLKATNKEYNPKYVRMIRMIEWPWEFRDSNEVAYDVGELSPYYMYVDDDSGKLEWRSEDYRYSFMTNLHNLAYMNRPIHIFFAEHDDEGYRNKHGGHYTFSKDAPTRNWAEYNA